MFLKRANNSQQINQHLGLLLDGQFFVECLSGDKLVPLFNGLVEYLDKAKAEK